ncbi:hypothetical protein BH10BAC2_BH10BAC2_15860 [soil metagenome]
MLKYIIIIPFLFLSKYDEAFIQHTHKTDFSNAAVTCKTQIDSVTKELIYITADVLPDNEGGDGLLSKRLQREIFLDDGLLTEELISKIAVTFIVDTDGSIRGERVVDDKTNKTGQQMLKIIKSLKWKPAICNNKKVRMLHTVAFNICYAEE